MKLKLRWLLALIPLSLLFWFGIWCLTPWHTVSSKKRAFFRMDKEQLIKDCRLMMINHSGKDTDMLGKELPPSSLSQLDPVYVHFRKDYLIAKLNVFPEQFLIVFSEKAAPDQIQNLFDSWMPTKKEVTEGLWYVQGYSTPPSR